MGILLSTGVLTPLGDAIAAPRTPQGPSALRVMADFLQRCVFGPRPGRTGLADRPTASLCCTGHQGVTG
jgi:hypothetical protein